jgi:hypothetical protein
VVKPELGKRCKEGQHVLVLVSGLKGGYCQNISSDIWVIANYQGMKMELRLWRLLAEDGIQFEAVAVKTPGKRLVGGAVDPEVNYLILRGLPLRGNKTLQQQGSPLVICVNTVLACPTIKLHFSVLTECGVGDHPMFHKAATIVE